MRECCTQDSASAMTPGDAARAKSAIEYLLLGKIPDRREFAAAGLMSYAGNLAEAYRRTASTLAAFSSAQG